MRTAILKRAWRAFGQAHLIPQLRGVVTAIVALLLTAANLSAGPTVTTLGGGNPHVKPKYLGYQDGITLSEALFHTPCGIAVNNASQYLLVADRDNNAIRKVDLVSGRTSTVIPNPTVPTNILSKPVGVAFDLSGNIYVLCRGTTNNLSTTGKVLQFDSYYDLIITNATGLTNANGIAVDNAANIYVTVNSNTLIQIVGTNINNIATVPTAGTSLQGIAIRTDGLIAACDAGRNGILLFDPDSGIVITNTGFNGPGDYTGVDNGGATPATAKFYQPYAVAAAGDKSLIITDRSNHRVKFVNATGITTNLYGVASNYWGGTYPGWYDGTVYVPDSITPNVQSRLPTGVALASDGTVYTTEDYYHTIRKVTGANLPQPPPPPSQVPAPQIGWVSFPPLLYTSVFNAGITNFASFVFNNDVPIVIVGALGSQTYYTYGVPPVPDPTRFSASAPVGYSDGLTSGEVSFFTVASIMPDFTIKAISEKNDGSPNSSIIEARFQFVVANPLIVGNNAAHFTISDITANCQFWYTIDGTDPTNAAPSLFLSTNSVSLTNVISLPISTNFTFKVRAFKNNYQPSGIVTWPFSTSNYLANQISFGLVSGEPHSRFLTRPGQFFYAPVTLELINPSDRMYSLQFNATVTNGLATPNKIVNGAGIDFFSMLMTQVTPDEGKYYPPADGNWYLSIPPVMFTSNDTNMPPISGTFVNTNNNLIGVIWAFRTGFKYNLVDTNGNVVLDFDTAAQDLITYSIAHDTLFNKSGGTVILGAYSFLIPTNANTGDQYFIQLGSPSATSDGVGADVSIQSPTNSQAVTVTNISYLVGDASPFHWFNAGDFGEGMLDNADVMQVFQSAVLGTDMPPTNSDLYLAMDSSGRMGVYDAVHNYYTDPGPGGNLSPAQQQAMYDGNDQSINTNAFGDGVLDVSDVYVTFRRSEDPSLYWWLRYWTNGQFVAVTTPNLAYNSNTPSVLVSKIKTPVTKSPALTTPFQQPFVSFSAGDAVVGQGQTIQIPINANVIGNYPLRILGLNITVHPLDGSPALTQGVQFTPAALGQLTQPSWGSASKSPGNYDGVWWPSGPIDSTTPGLSSNVTLGTLTVKVPANATGLSAYAVHFDNVSASPNGIISFPKATLTGLITLTSRTNSSYGDGIPDSWRLRWFGTTNNLLSISNACPSGDGVNNWQKYVAGVDPNVANDFPSLNAKTPIPSGSAMAIHWPTVSGKQYVVLHSTSLFPGNWTAICTNTGTGTDMEFDDPNPASAGYYRVQILP